LEQGGGGTKKKNVVTDGYDSDSSAGSDGGFGGAGGGRAGKGGEQAAEPDDDEDDMFGGGPGVDEGMDIKGKKKEKDTLELGDIEGQEFGKGDEEDNDSDLEEDEEDYLPEDDLANTDEAPRGKRSKKGMGYQVSCVFSFLSLFLWRSFPSFPPIAAFLCLLHSNLSSRSLLSAALST
jgi:CD2 antigen cytoplasmic tail-binding protein 2